MYLSNSRLLHWYFVGVWCTGVIFHHTPANSVFFQLDSHLKPFLYKILKATIEKVAQIVEPPKKGDMSLVWLIIAEVLPAWDLEGSNCCQIEWVISQIAYLITSLWVRNLPLRNELQALRAYWIEEASNVSTESHCMCLKSCKSNPQYNAMSRASHF